MTTTLPSQRALFEIPDHVVYLNCAYMSPNLKSVRAAGERGIQRKSAPWALSPADFFSYPDATRGLFGDLIGASGEDIAIIPSASYGVGMAAANLDTGPGRDILVLEGQFPSNIYPWRRRAQATGASVLTVPAPGDDPEGWTPRILEAISGQIGVVALPHCHWTDGSLIDLVAIGARVREVGAALVLDVCQSLGALPLDVRAVDPDFLIAPCYKWLLGPYSLGFAYVAPRHQTGEPLEQSWIVRQGAEDFAGLVNYRDDFAPGARRFDMGERAQFHLLPMAAAALQQLHAWDVPRIAESLAALTRAISQRARAMGFIVPEEHTRAPHFVGARWPGGLPDDLLDRLRERHIYLSARGTALRITPHLYNTEEDIDRLFRALKDLL